MDEERAPRRIPLVWLLVPFVLSTIAGYVGDIVGPRLINDHPLAQIALNPRNRWLLLAAPQLDAVSFFVVGFFRLVSTDPMAFLIGWQYGDQAIAWVEKKMGDETGLVRKIERWFGKIAPLVILVAPSWNWCVLAGAARMKPQLFVALNLTGTIGRLALFWVAGDAFKDQLEDVLELIQRYQWWLVGLSVAVIALQMFRKGEVVETPEELAAEIEGEHDD